MESVKMKKATKTVAFRQLAIYCNIVDNQLLTDASGIHHWIPAAIHFKRYKSYSDNWTKSKRKC